MQPDKKALRAGIRARKQLISPEEIAVRSQQLCQLVLMSDAYKESKTIYGYLPFNQEVDLTPLLTQALADGKQVALPKCYGPQMRFILVSDLSHIRHTVFGVPEPVADSPVAEDETGLVIVPGLLFDRQGYRIGYGGGYYDRFLAWEPRHPTIGLCFDFQITDLITPAPHDVPVATVFSV